MIGSDSISKQKRCADIIQGLKELPGMVIMKFISLLITPYLGSFRKLRSLRNHSGFSLSKRSTLPTIGTRIMILVRFFARFWRAFMSWCARSTVPVKRLHKVSHVIRLIAELIRKVLKKNDEILALAKELYEEKSLLLMGRGYNYATCLEGALKVKEVNKSLFY